MAITRSSSEIEAISVVDFSDILSGSKDLSSCPQVKEFHSALSTVGFVFLKNHGINKEMVGFISTLIAAVLQGYAGTSNIILSNPAAPPPLHTFINLDVVSIFLNRWTRYSRYRRPFSCKIFLQRNHSSEEILPDTMAMCVWSKKGWATVNKFWLGYHYHNRLRKGKGLETAADHVPNVHRLNACG